MNGPLFFVNGSTTSGTTSSWRSSTETAVRLGMILESSEGSAVVQVFEGTSGLSIPDTRVRFRGEPLKFGVGAEILGRVFDGLGARSTAVRPRWSRR